MMDQFKLQQTLLGIVIATAGFLGQGAFSPASAVCIGSNSGNNCTTFNPSTPSTATYTYTSLNLVDNRYFQFGAKVNPGSGSYNITNIEFSFDNSVYQPLAASLIASNTGFAYSSIFDSYDFTNPDTNIGIPFYVRLTIPSGVTVGETIGTELRTNNNSAQVSNVLTDASNNFAAIQRESVAVPLESDALPIFIAGAFVGGGMWLKRKRAEKSLAALQERQETNT